MPKRIGTILTNIIPNEHLWKIKLFGYWETIIGNLKEKVRIEKLTETSLTIGVCHPTWAQELFLLSPMLKQKINTYLQENKIKNIQFKTVRFTTPKTSHQSKQDSLTEKTYRTEHCLTIIEHSKLQLMKNTELAQSLEQFYIRCKKIKP
ncbi:DUF721 domain-containing protein [Candidatus Dependentiae bacterium]|nr:DUF721 domain-containing protein [Candidatus Dependentiae bacterium]